jgi:hypothetical protein
MRLNIPTAVRTAYLMEALDLDVSWYTHDDLVNLAYDDKALAKLDGGDLRNIIRELTIRLQRTTDQLQRLER